MDMNKPPRVDSSLFPSSASLLEAGGDLPSPNLEILPARPVLPPSDAPPSNSQSQSDISQMQSLATQNMIGGELPPTIPLGQFPGVNTEDNPYRLKKSQIGAYKTTNTTPFQAPLPFTSPGAQSIPQSVPTAYDVTQQQQNIQTGLTAPSMNPPLTQYYPAPVQPRPVYVPDALRPVWMYKLETAKYWSPFSKHDCACLEQAYQCHLANEDPSTSSKSSREGIKIAVEGSRYDVMLFERTRQSVFWREEEREVRRCTWYYKGDMDREFIPFPETHAARLEEEFQVAVKQDLWPRKITLGTEGVVVMSSPFAMVQFCTERQYTGPFPGLHETQGYPSVITRDYPEWDSVTEGDIGPAKHLVFVVHGIGERSNMLVSIEECVSDMRQVSNIILGCNPAGLQDLEVGRVEFLPIAWHTCLRSDYDNVDLRLDAISLTSTPKIRHFSNTVLTDILFYTSPLYCQTIIDTTTSEMNRLFSLYKARNPEFRGNVSLMGHSLGSCILFDLLANQTKDLEPELTSPDTLTSPDSFTPSSVDEVLIHLGLQDISHILSSQQIDMESLKMLSEGDLKELGISMGARKKLFAYISEWKSRSTAKSEKRFLDGCPPPGEVQGYNIIKGVCGTGQISINYPKLDFEPSFFFCIGSPIGLFLSVRGTQNLGYNFSFPTCGGFYHIYHPYDYVAYRIEPLIDPEFKSDPELLPHIRGGKRLHLELKENLERLGSGLKQTIMYGVHSAVSSIQEFAKSHTMPEGTSKLIPPSIEEIKARQSIPTPPDPPHQFQSSLNHGQRVDYVLQVKGIEAINDYLFALSSHSCYWRSEDTVLFCLTKIFSSISS